MAVDWTRVPVLIGAGQVTNRVEDPATSPDPFALMEEATRLAAHAAHDRRGGGLIRSLTHLWMVHSLSLRHGDPAAELARRLGADTATSRCSGMGGSVPQWLVNRAAELVVAGDRPRVLIAGAEALATRRRAKAAGLRLDWPTSEGWPDTWPPIEPDVGVHPVERANGLDQATTMYALVESALAHAAGQTPEEHTRTMGVLMAGLNAVAAGNPHAWFRTLRSAAELVTVTPDNRMVNLPYPKYCNAVMDVDMGAAGIVTDARTARDLGLDPADIAYLTGWADAHEVWNLSARPAVHRAPALEACGATALAMAGTSLDELGAFDLYACFPSSIEVARDSLGIAPDDPRPLTLTGGLPSAGGPGSNAVTHAIANALDWLRAGRGHATLVQGNGYYLTKQALGVYTNHPPTSNPEPVPGLQDRLDAGARPLEIVPSPSGGATVVAATVPYGRDGEPGAGIVLVDLDGTPGRRSVARADPVLTAALVAGDPVGQGVTITPGEGGGPNCAAPA